MNELKSYTEYAVSTPTSDFVIGFDFNYGEDAVNVTVDNVPASEAGYTVVYLDESTIQLSPSVPSGVVRLQRETDIDQSDHAYRAGAKFIAQTMDENFEQLRHSQQEVRDGFYKLSDDTYAIIDTLEDVAQSAQDAADDANAAAQVANDAAAQVADKVSQSELVDALDPLYDGVNYVGRYTPLPYKNAKNYEVGERVTLSTGEVVENLVLNNNVNPNTDMLGWVKVNSASRVFDESGKTQQEINTAQKDKNSLTVDLLEFIPKSEWAAIAARTSSYDCTPALVSAVATGKKVTIGLSGTYKLNTPYNGTTNFELEATAAGVVLDGDSNTSNYVITNSGGVDKLAATFAAPEKHGVSVTLSSVTGLKVGDWLCFYSPTPESYSSWRTYYNAGEWKQIRAIIGNIVWFTQPFYDNYAGIALDLYKLNSVICKISNVKLYRQNGLAGFIRFTLSSNAADTDVDLDLKVREGIYYDRCVSPISTRSKGINNGTGSGTDNDYAIVYGNCQHARAFNVDLYSRRHAIALGGSNSICAVPTSDFRGYNSILRADPDVLVGAADMHGNVRDSSYEDCVIYGSTNIGGGEDCYYRRCKIYSDVQGVCGFAREIKGGNFGWIDCDYYVLGDPQVGVGRAVIDIGSNNNGAVNEKTTIDCNITITGRAHDASLITSAAQFVRIRNRGTLKKINPTVRLDMRTVNSFGFLLYMDVITAGVAESDGIIADSFTGNLRENGYVVRLPETLAGQSYLNKPLRMQRQTAISEGVTTATTQLTLSQKSFKIQYPRVPAVSLALRKKGGASASTIGGQQNVSVGVFNMDTYRVTPRISSDEAMTAGDEVEVAITVEIAEC